LTTKKQSLNLFVFLVAEWLQGVAHLKKEVVSTKKIKKLFAMPLLALIYQAQKVHQKHFRTNTIQISTLLSIKTGACPEDCAYCPQSAHYKTGLKVEKLMSLETVVEAAKQAKQNGATRFCMGAAWRSPPKDGFQKVLTMIQAVKALGLETCVTLGMLTGDQSCALKEAGLDFYNHNLDTSPRYYKEIITTRDFEDRLKTLDCVRKAGIKVCCGGIIGMGETREDRIELLKQLANLPIPPESVPINHLIPVEGTPLGKMTVVKPLDSFEFVRTIAVARILMPKAVVRLSAGREHMNDELQALCFMAGANSIFLGEKLLTRKNPDIDRDNNLLQRLGMISEHSASPETA